MEKRIIYHGSNVVVEKPEIFSEGHYKDFGYGFYCTDFVKQARRWAKTRRGASIVSRYSYLESKELSTCKFSKMSDDWLQFIVDCRMGKRHGFDIVEGPMADDRIWDYVGMYTQGNIAKETFFDLVKFTYSTHQIVFCTGVALEALHFEGSETL